MKSFMFKTITGETTYTTKACDVDNGYYVKDETGDIIGYYENGFIMPIDGGNPNDLKIV